MSTNVKRIAIGLVAIVVLGAAPLAGVWIARASAPKPKEAAAALPAATAQPAGTTGDFVGVLLPPQMANLSPRIDGRVQRVDVKIGQTVKAGTLLVGLDPREKRQELAMAEASLRVARASAAGAGSDFVAARKRAARRNAVVDVGGQRIPLVSGEEAAQAQYEAQGAAARAASASAQIGEQQAKVEQLKLALEHTEIRAPFDGVVTGVYVEPGATIQPSQIAVRVIGGQGLRARMAVPEDAVSAVRARKQAVLTLDDRVQLVASIDQIAPEIDPASRTFVVEGVVAQHDAICRGDCTQLAGRVVRGSVQQ